MRRKTDMQGFKEALKECRAAIYDLDGTLIGGNVSVGIGKRYLLREAQNAFAGRQFKEHAKNACKGIANYWKVKRIAKKDGSAEGLRCFTNILAETGAGDIESAKQFAKEYIEKHELLGARKFVIYLKYSYGIPAVISTIAWDIAAERAVECFGCDHSISNRVMHDNGIITGFIPVMNDGMAKHERTCAILENLYGFGIDECLVVGNDGLDHEMMRTARISAASPLADEETKALADVWIKDYGAFAEELKKR